MKGMLKIATVLVALGVPMVAQSATIEVCHQMGGGKMAKLTTSEAALKGHQGHGDWVVTAEICGDGIDNDCDGQIDECISTCPCFSQAEFDIAKNVVTSTQWTNVLGAGGCETPDPSNPQVEPTFEAEVGEGGEYVYGFSFYVISSGRCGVTYYGNDPSGTYSRSVTAAEAKACMSQLATWCGVMGPILKTLGGN